MKKISRVLLFVLGLGVQGAVFAGPNDIPFADRYPPESINSMERAQEVITAYEKEKAEWDQWRSVEDKACYRNFFVNDCLDDNKKKYAREVAKARAVWLKARDFERQYKANETKAKREANLTKQKQKIAQHKDHSDKDVFSDTTRTQERDLTLEQEQANQKEYELKQQRHKERVKQEQMKEKPTPSTTMDERLKARAERRKAAEAKRLENIRKRASKAAEYERQVKLREEQKNQVLEDLSTIIYK